MSEFASAAENLARVRAAMTRLEIALEGNPEDQSLLTNLSAQRKLARRIQEELSAASAEARMDVCDYRIVPEVDRPFTISSVTRSLAGFQNAFSIIYEAKTLGVRKRKAKISKDMAERSAFQIGYTYPGSFGVALFVPDRSDMFRSEIDVAVETLFQVLAARDEFDVRDIAQSLGEAVVRKVFEWSSDNYNSEYAIDLRWNLASGRQTGEFIARPRFARLMSIISSTTDQEWSEETLHGKLNGLDIELSSYNLHAEGVGESRGSLHAEFDRNQTYEIGVRYKANIVTSVITHVATERQETRHFLRALRPVP